MRAACARRSFPMRAPGNSLLNGAIRATIHPFGILGAPKAGVAMRMKGGRLDCIQRSFFLDGGSRIADYFCC